MNSGSLSIIFTHGGGGGGRDDGGGGAGGDARCLG